MRAKFIRGEGVKKGLNIGAKRGILRDFDETLRGFGFVEDTPADWPKPEGPDTDIRLLYHYHYVPKSEFRMEVYEMIWDPGSLQTYFYEKGSDYEHSHYNISMKEYFMNEYFLWDKLEKKLGI